MKLILLITIFLTCLQSKSQHSKNLIIVTIDGLRWQEIFKGADPDLINNTRYVADTTILKLQYFADVEENRRKKLLPFFWNVIKEQGQIFGNRDSASYVAVQNPYKISYPGYNELLTGYADPFVVSNKPKHNKNKTILEKLNNLDEFNNKVVVFSSWSLFPYIINRERSNLYINSGNENLDSEDAFSELFNQVQLSIYNKTGTRQDALTHTSAMNYIQEKHPRVALISFGETDEYAHAKRYDLYLQKINAFDRYLSELWYMVQSDPFYKDQTTILITTDHGRGNKEKNWFKHNNFVEGSNATWFALIGNSISPKGEITNSITFVNQLANKMMDILNIPIE